MSRRRDANIAIIGIVAATVVMGLLGFAIASKLEKFEAGLCMSPCTCTCPGV